MRLCLSSLHVSLLVLSLAGCSLGTNDQRGDAGADARSGGDGGGTAQDNDGSASAADGSSAADAGDGAASDACTALLDDIQTAFAGAGPLGDCRDVPGGAKIAESLLSLRGSTIDNEGKSMAPCVEARCDDRYAYIASNDLPHYDFVPMTPNALAEAPSLFRIPLAARALTEQGAADDSSSVNGCTDAYEQFLFEPATATPQEPSQLCSLGTVSYLYDKPKSGRVDYQRIPCISAIGAMISGVRVYGPNEAATPDPWGNPGYNYPNDLVSDDYGTGAALDLCGGHTGDAMHYHAAKYACFEGDAERKPLHSYEQATTGFDLGQELDGECSEPSAIIGWAPDGYPIKGPCICVARDEQGKCTAVRKARSGWTYDGLGIWGNDAGEATSLGKEGSACSSDSDCCSGAGCHFSCSYTLVDDAKSPGGSAAEKRCVLIDYAWCVHRFHTRDDSTPDGVSFAYLDRCNGFEGPEGYAYHATFTFPFLLGCYRGEVGVTNSWYWQAAAGMGDGMMGGEGTQGDTNKGDMMGGTPPMCVQGQTSMCCGDGKCDGPETSANCAADC